MPVPTLVPPTVKATVSHQGTWGRGAPCFINVGIHPVLWRAKSGFLRGSGISTFISRQSDRGTASGNPAHLQTLNPMRERMKSGNRWTRYADLTRYETRPPTYFSQIRHDAALPCKSSNVFCSSPGLNSQVFRLALNRSASQARRTSLHWFPDFTSQGRPSFLTNKTPPPHGCRIFGLWMLSVTRHISAPLSSITPPRSKADRPMMGGSGLVCGDHTNATVVQAAATPMAPSIRAFRARTNERLCFNKPPGKLGYRP
jgi:hypothetical protein